MRRFDYPASRTGLGTMRSLISSRLSMSTEESSPPIFGRGPFEKL